MSEFNVETNIPIPDRPKGGAPLKYPWPHMKVGHSFFVPRRNANEMSTAARAWRNRNDPSQEHKARTVTENGVKGTRVWRMR